MKDKAVINWDFEAVNDTDYLICFDMVADKNMFDMILSKTLEKLRRRGKHAIVGKAETFEIEERYYNLLHTILNKQIKEVSRNVGEDGIVMLNSKVEYGKFTKKADGTGWNIKTKVGGTYGRK
jgi:hypothetical protein